MNYSIKKMTLEDFELIKDNLISDFDDFWTSNVLENELNSENSYYFVAKNENEILGFVGIKIIFDQADIMNIVVKKASRRKSEFLIIYLILSLILQKKKMFQPLC